MNLSTEVDEAIERAIQENSHPDEHVGYLANMTVANTEAGIPSAITIITLRLNAAVPGEYITQAFFVDSPIPTYEEVAPHIGDLLMRMRASRIAHIKRVIQQNEEAGHERAVTESPDGHVH